MYALRENKSKREKVKKFWENARLYQAAQQPAMKRLNTLIEMADWPEKEWPQQDKDLYSLGHVRTTQKFFKTFGIHVEEKTVEHHLCQFVGSESMVQVFMPALRKNRMGVDYDKIDYEFVDPMSPNNRSKSFDESPRALDS